MKKHLIYILLLVFGNLTFTVAQNIAINKGGALPNPSSMLDIDISGFSSKKGLLIPRVTAAEKTSMNPLPAPAQGLVVYQTNGVQGFYYNTSANTTPVWVYLLPSGGNNGGWTTVGNSLTVTGTDFIGTSDNNPFVLKTKSSEYMRFTTNLNVGVGVTNPQLDIEIKGDSGIAVYRKNLTLTSGIRSESPRIRYSFYDYDDPCNSLPAGVYTLVPRPTFARPIFLFKNKNGAMRCGIFLDTLHSMKTFAEASVAFGYDVGALGKASMAIGGGSGATANYATAMGYNAYASGSNSTAFSISQSRGKQSLSVAGITRDSLTYCFGTNDVVKTGGVAIGFSNYVRGINSVVLGFQTNSIADNNITIGTSGLIPGCSSSYYRGITNNISNSLMIGFNSDTATFYIGPSAGLGTTGNVGIGTVNPSSKLDVNGKTTTAQLQVTAGAVSGSVLTSDASGNATWQSVPSATATAWGLSGNTGTTAGTNFIGTTDATDFVFKTNSAEKLRILSGGNIGIGTASPLNKLDVSGAMTIGSLYAGINTAPVNGLLVEGKVGVGVSSPLAKLDVRSSNVTTASTTVGNLHVMTTDAQNIDFGASISLGGYNDNAASALRVFGTIEGRKQNINSGSSSGYLSFKTNNAGNLLERMRIDYLGNVGIGTTLPGSKFHVSGSETATHGKNACIELSNTSSTNNWYLRSGATGTATPTDGFSIADETNYRFVIDASGNVGIGCTTPSQRLSVSGNIYASGTILASQGTTCSSDRRFKKDINPLNNALENVLKLEGVNYYWKKDEFPERGFNDSLQIGFIAQDLEKVFPQMVFTAADGYKSVDYSRLTPVLVEAIKEQNTSVSSNDDDLNTMILQAKQMKERLNLFNINKDYSAESN